MDLAQGDAMAVKRHDFAGLQSADPAVVGIFLVEPDLGVFRDQGHEHRHHLDAVAFGSVEMVAEIGRIQPLRSQPGLLQQLAHRGLPTGLVGLQASGYLAPHPGKPALGPLEQQHLRARADAAQDHHGNRATAYRKLFISHSNRSFAGACWQAGLRPGPRLRARPGGRAGHRRGR